MRRRARIGVAAVFSLVVLLLTLPLGAQVPTQRSLGVGVESTGYAFDAGLGADAAALLLLPVAGRTPLGSRGSLDVYGAWARGRVEVDGADLSLSGPVDTHVRLGFQATPWALLTVGAQLPTGNASHDGEEALVASVLATELLGFGESSWGSGAALTTSLATAREVGTWGVGAALAYAARGSFAPDESDADFRYEPGDELRVRVGADRNIGDNTLTLGGTFISYGDDRANARNLFRAGDRLRLDASYAFRAGAGVWTVYASDVLRSNGDLTLDVVDDFGSVVGDTTVATAEQNLLVAGLVGAVGLGSGFVFRPIVDLRLQSRTEPDGSDTGSGWILGLGGDLPIRFFSRSEIFPRARLLLGSIRDRQGEGVGVRGLELRATLRWSP